MSHVHVIGAGLAGLSAAVRLADAGARVVVWEQTSEAGGRARSFHDVRLDRLIDNGNHLLLSGNRAALDYLALIAAENRLTGPDGARFDFLDLETRERWSVDLNRGPVPLWVMSRKRRVAGTSLGDYLAGLRLLTAGNRTVFDLFGGDGQMYRRFWEPFAIAVLNTDPKKAAARLLVPVIRETLARGAQRSRPLIARTGLTDTFVAPALRFLEQHGGEIRYGRRITAIVRDGSRVTGLQTSRGAEPLGPEDGVVMAVPAWAAPDLIEGLKAPQSFAPIVNVHLRIDRAPSPLRPAPLLGLVGGVAQWLFVREDVASVTVSAAHQLIETSPDEIIARVWPEVALALDLDAALKPVGRVVKEHRATFQATPTEIARRPATATAWRNLVMAGDWTDTGLPATIESAIRSGEKAAAALA
jgi:squalene-associated FAD-dependent desaturase